LAEAGAFRRSLWNIIIAVAATGLSAADLAAEYKSVDDAYSCNYIDFDIEGADVAICTYFDKYRLHAR